MSGIPLLPVSPVGFPDPQGALEQPDGLLAAGGALDPEWLLTAYANGIFPWFDSDDDHILWWSPSERAVLVPGTMRVTRSLKKRINNGGFSHSFDRDFQAVIAACQQPRSRAQGTWITAKMCAAYTELHARGFAHSCEIWLDGELVGGLYGICLGRMFFGESMFSRANDASKVALFHLQSTLHEWGFMLIDCQLMNPHLETLGVGPMGRDQFLRLVEHNDITQAWHSD